MRFWKERDLHTPMANLLRRTGHCVLFLVLWAVLLNGCSSWQVVTEPPGQDRPADIRAKLTDDTTVEFKSAFALGDTLYGLGPGSAYMSTQGESRAWDNPVSLSMSEIESLEQKKTDGRRTGIAILGGTLVLGAIVGLIVLANSDLDGLGPNFSF